MDKKDDYACPKDDWSEMYRIHGYTDFAIKKKNPYPKRDDTAGTDYYGRKRRRESEK